MIGRLETHGFPFLKYCLNEFAFSTKQSFEEVPVDKLYDK